MEFPTPVIWSILFHADRDEGLLKQRAFLNVLVTHVQVLLKQYKLYLFHVLPVATPWGFMGMKRGSFHCFGRGECAALWTRHLYFDLWELDDCHQHFFLLNFLYSDPGE